MFFFCAPPWYKFKGQPALVGFVSCVLISTAEASIISCRFFIVGFIYLFFFGAYHISDCITNEGLYAKQV